MQHADSRPLFNYGILHNSQNPRLAGSILRVVAAIEARGRVAFADSTVVLAAAAGRSFRAGGAVFLDLPYGGGLFGLLRPRLERIRKIAIFWDSQAGSLCIDTLVMQRGLLRC
jgi:hypothetical protein